MTLRMIAVLCISLVAASLSGQREQQKTNPLVPKQGPEQQAPPSLPSTPLVAAEMTPADLNAFFDGAVPILLQSNDIAGAVICVVRDNKILFAKGYGYMDVEKKTPVTPDTMFRPGSISKLFTWTAVMQLVEQGKLSLDADVNQYLDFTVPHTFGKPVTLRNLMTHTPGFEEEVKDLIQPDAKRMMPLGRYMRERQPRQIFTPGTIPAYSNYGAGLAGYIVQRVSGENFEDYIRKHIFEPLHMQHSTFAQPLPEDLKPFMATGYTRASNKAGWYEMVEPAPAGALAASANDLSRFMIAHLNDGEFPGWGPQPVSPVMDGEYATYGSRRILEAKTAQLMHTRAFGLDPTMNGMALGFYEESLNGHRIIGHGGDTIYFHSDMHLMADAHLGFFISFNSAGKSGPPRRILWQRFLDRYFPYMPPATQPRQSAAQDAKAVFGYYLTTRRMETTVLRIASLLGVMKVHPDEKNTVVADDINGFNGRPKKWQEFTPGLEKTVDFRNADGLSQDRLAFVPGPNGQTLLIVDFPAVAWQRVPWYYAPKFMITVLVLVCSLFIIAIVWWLIAGPLTRRHYQRRLELDAPLRKSRRWMRWTALFQLAALAGWLGILQSMGSDDAVPTGKTDWALHLMTIVAWIGLVLTIAAIIHLVRTWSTAQYRFFTRVAETLLVLACFGYVWLSYGWNMYHWNLNF
jgi:CubicO group peptidase (beta-lactamase class C family)